MKKLKEIFNKNRGLIFTFSTLFVLLLVLNSLTIWAADDYAFYNNVWTGHEKFSLLRIYERCTEFYLTWTGRYLSTFVNYIFLYFPKWVYNIANTSVYLGLVYLIYKMTKKDETTKEAKKQNIFLVITIFCLTWLLTPAVGQVMFWQIGSVIYLWMYFLVALLIYYYTMMLRGKNKTKDNILNMVLIFILGLAAGNGFETNSLVLLMYLFLTLVYEKFIKKNKLTKVAIVGFIGSFIGFCTNFFSPGNSVRMDSMEVAGGLVEKIFYGLGPWFYNGIFRSKMFITLTILLLVYIMYILSKRKNIDQKTGIFLSTVGLFLGGFIMTIAYLLPGDLPKFLNWFYPNTLRFWFILIVLLSLAGIMVLAFIIYRKHLLKGTEKTTNALALNYTLAALFGTAAYIMTPTAWPRSYMAMALTLVMAIVYILVRIDFKKQFKFVPKAFFVIIVSLSAIIYVYTVYDAYQATTWQKETDKIIKEKIDNGEEVIYVDTFVSKSNHNGASIERWVIPIKEENGKINESYEWINEEVTNYYFKDNKAWDNGKMIIGK